MTAVGSKAATVAGLRSSAIPVLRKGGRRRSGAGWVGPGVAKPAGVVPGGVMLGGASSWARKLVIPLPGTRTGEPGGSPGLALTPKPGGVIACVCPPWVAVAGSLLADMKTGLV